MLFVVGFVACVLAFIYYRFFIYTHKVNHQTDVNLDLSPSESGDKWGPAQEIDKSLNENLLKQEFLMLFKEIYKCFSTGQLQHISSKMSDEILLSLKQSIKARDEARFTHTFKNDPLCTIQDISINDQNVVSIRAEFQSEQVISVEDMNDITDNVVDLFVFEKTLNKKNEPWKLVHMG